jgi:orotidine-5'-phosphate decarboxylase
MVKGAGASVFLDLKFHDIPQTIAGAVSAAARLGVSLLTVHCAAGPAGLRAAADAAAGVRVLGVTRLTSEGGRLGRAVLAAAAQAQESGVHGVTAAVRDARAIKKRFGSEFLVLTPGIRPAGHAANDQVRVATPAQAVRAGADFLVVGRPVTSAPDPEAAAEALLAEIARAARRGHTAAETVRA